MERCLVDRSEEHTPPLQHMHVLIRVSLLSYEAHKLSCIFSQVAGERKGGLFLARVERGRGMAPGRWEMWGVQWILAELNVFSVGNSCIRLDWLFWNRLQLGFCTPSHCGVSPGLLRVCEKFLNSKGSFFGTAVSFLFRHLKNLGEPYKDQKQV